jgi:hypothetical protein
MISSVRLPRLVKSSPTQSNSSRIQPTPIPRVTRPPETRSSVTTSRAVRSGWCRGSMQTLVASRMVVVAHATKDSNTNGL